MKFIFVILLWLICDNIVFSVKISKIHEHMNKLDSELKALKGYYFSFNTDKEC